MSVNTERKGLSSGFERYQNKNKLFLLNPNNAQRQPPSLDFLLDAAALLAHPPYSSSSSLSEVPPLQLLISYSLIMPFGWQETICFQGC